MKVKSIKVNAILNIIYTITNMIFPLVTFPYVSRILLAEGMGKVSFFTSVSNYAIMVGALGISTYGIRTVAKARADEDELNRVTMELLIINTLATLSVVIALLLLIPVVEKFRIDFILYIINIIIIITAPIGLNWLYSGLEQYEYITKRTIVFKTISIMLVFILVKEKKDYPMYAAITAFSTIGAYVCNFLYARKFVTFHFYKGLRYKRHYKPMLLLFASILAVHVYTNLDTIMLGFLCGDIEVGLYTIAVKIKWLLLSVVNAISAVLLPRLSFYLSEKNTDEYKRILKKSVSIIFFISIPLTIFFIIEARDSILLLGGADYIDAVMCMKIIMPILVISGFSNITGNQILVPHGKDSAFMTAVVIGAIVDIFLNAFLMPVWGCTGAAVATLLAEMTQMSIQLYYAKAMIVKSINFKTIYKFILSALVACFIVIVVRKIIDINAFVNLAITFTIYFGVYVGIIALFNLQAKS